MMSQLQRLGMRSGVLIGICVCVLALVLVIPAYPQEDEPSALDSSLPIPRDILLRIVEAEDKRLWNNNLSALLADRSPSVRKRAALAAGRIGDERAIPALVSMFQETKDRKLRAMAVFALGEIESPAAAEALIAQLAQRDVSDIKARAIEALGKITAALPATDKARLTSFQKEIYNALEFEASRRSEPHTEAILLGLTAALRARPEGVGKVIAKFLNYSDPRIRADAANALARLRAKDGNDQLRKLLTTDTNPIVRANAARVLGATEDRDAFDGLLDRGLKDDDQRVRVSAIRALASLREPKAAMPLLKRGQQLNPRRDANELREIVTTLGRVSQDSKHQATIDWLRQLIVSGPEVEIAIARINPEFYSSELWRAKVSSDMNYIVAMGNGAAELANVKTGDSALDERIKSDTIKIILSSFPLPIPAVPDWLRALAAFKIPNAAETLRKHLLGKDVIVRATAAELLAELPPDQVNEKALVSSLPTALNDRELNDAALAILDALARQKTSAANDAIKTALDAPDYLIRRRAVSLLRENGAGDFSARIGAVQTRNTRADYERAISRAGKNVRAIVTTYKGAFTIELLPNEAPLTVDSFVQLSRRGYFKNISFHRVVPNFVIQGGDPRGDGNGGPGYSIRCEINQIPYERGAVGMALSGKDTGGSQWFVTHSPQPHLDGGYTVFGRVIAGMDVVDRIARGDMIRSIVINEAVGPNASVAP
jgi:cyclophilin family peptidyl-prolyl cis-trans isomerase/HEAT repeat protein